MSISGTVTDATGLILPGVTVEERAAAGIGQVAFIGTRAQPRSVTESPVPVDVIPTEDVVSQGSTDLASQLRTVVPSFNINTQPISDSATIVRPANLRNLAPDHTLILVNGKRRHRVAVITWLGNGIADGSQGPDLSVIPSVAIRQAEVQRDGAAAQYGSDAIAGVMNFQLKGTREGGSLEFCSGAFMDANPGSASTFVSLSMEYGNANPTNRCVQRNDAQAIIDVGNGNIRNPAQVWGSPLFEDDLKLFGDFGNLFENGLQFYGHTNYAQREATAGAAPASVAHLGRYLGSRSAVIGYFDLFEQVGSWLKVQVPAL